MRPRGQKKKPKVEPVFRKEEREFKRMEQQHETQASAQEGARAFRGKLWDSPAPGAQQRDRQQFDEAQRRRREEIRQKVCGLPLSQIAIHDHVQSNIQCIACSGQTR